MKFFLSDWLRFSKKESLGIIALLLVMVFFLFLPAFYSSPIVTPKVDSGLIHYLNEKSNNVIDSSTIIEHHATTNVALKMFYFDPNELDKIGWERLGINQKTIGTIFRYRQKGGRFRKPEDLRKIWGLLPSDADRIIPFVLFSTNNSLPYNRAVVPIKKQPILDVNKASVSDWESLPGIGPVLANRIVKFREKLGGFTTLDQVAKTYGITDTVFNTIRPFLSIEPNDSNSSSNNAIELNKSIIKKDSIVNINTASVAGLVQAGIDEGLAKAIVLYRKQYGKFAQLADLKQIILINEAVYQQIVPKLKVD
ncbi:MAG: helix-hairpin-helix domain-containing protein [Sphingobacteriia bacterium]|jgi:DNA uptake protein ComE-like DNA-binding protein